jgi:hypothetical protein
LHSQLLSQLQASEHDKFAAHLYRSRKEYRSACQRAGKSGKQIERCLISTFQVAESLGFKGDIRQWQELLRMQVENCAYVHSSDEAKDSEVGGLLAVYLPIHPNLIDSVDRVFERSPGK